MNDDIEKFEKRLIAFKKDLLGFSRSKPQDKIPINYTKRRWLRFFAEAQAVIAAARLSNDNSEQGGCASESVTKS